MHHLQQNKEISFLTFVIDLRQYKQNFYTVCVFGYSPTISGRTIESRYVLVGVYWHRPGDLILQTVSLAAALFQR